ANSATPAFLIFYSCGQRIKRTCLHDHLTTAARVFDCVLLSTRDIIHDNRRFVNRKFEFYFQIISEFLNVLKYKKIYRQKSGCDDNKRQEKTSDIFHLR